MYPPCEVVGRFVLPIFRSLIAKELIEKYSFTQVEAAEKLGTTQAAISQYIHSKRGMKGIAHFEEGLPKIQAAANEIGLKRELKEELGVKVKEFKFICKNFYIASNGERQNAYAS